MDRGLHGEPAEVLVLSSDPGWEAVTEVDHEPGALLLDAVRAQLDLRVEASNQMWAAAMPSALGPWRAAALTEAVLGALSSAGQTIVDEALAHATALCGLSPPAPMALRELHADTVVAVVRTVDRYHAGRMPAVAAYAAASNVGLRAQGVRDLAEYWRIACDFDQTFVRTLGTVLVTRLGEAADRQVERSVVGWMALLARSDTGGTEGSALHRAGTGRSIGDRWMGRRPRGVLHLTASLGEFAGWSRVTGASISGIDEVLFGALRRSTCPASALGIAIHLSATSQESLLGGVELGRNEVGELTVRAAGKGAVFLEMLAGGFGCDAAGRGAALLLDQLAGEPLARLPVSLDDRPG